MSWTGGLNADDVIPIEWQLEGFQAFTDHSADCLIWFADFAGILWQAPTALTLWLADPKEDWQAGAAPTSWVTEEDEPGVWVADGIETRWCAERALVTWKADDADTLWVSDPPMPTDFEPDADC